MTGQTHPIAVMDGTCALCAFVARMVHRLDRPGDIRIAPIQGATGAALMRDYGFEPLDLDSWLFIDEYCTATRDLDSLIRLGQRTGGISWLLLCFKVFPKPSRNRIYACARATATLCLAAPTCATSPTRRSGCVYSLEGLGGRRNQGFCGFQLSVSSCAVHWLR